GELAARRVLRELRKEIVTGLILGLLFGLLLASAAFVMFGREDLSMIVGCSIATTMTLATMWGTVLPLLFQRFGVDPAVASGPLVTTSTDLLSITVYFTVAALLLGNL
ncbi:MAG: magnesium transporter, partial [Bdellovibrionales bacterium]|nr:magnesium transporter [Bdellovibrionales bacterium]